jgi:hypothetical protein
LLDIECEQSSPTLATLNMLLRPLALQVGVVSSAPSRAAMGGKGAMGARDR